MSRRKFEGDVKLIVGILAGLHNFSRINQRELANESNRETENILRTRQTSITLAYMSIRNMFCR